MLELAKKPQPANVLLSLVSMLQSLNKNERWELAQAILSSEDNVKTIAAENKLTLMTWYGVEPCVFSDGAIEKLAVPKLQQFAARRIATDIENNAVAASKLLTYISKQVDAKNDDQAGAMLFDVTIGLAGRAKVTAPESWPALERSLKASANKNLQVAGEALGVLFGDGASMEGLRRFAADSSQDYVARDKAILALAQAKDEESIPMFFNLLGDRAVYSTVIKALAGFDHPEHSEAVAVEDGRIQGWQSQFGVSTQWQVVKATHLNSSKPLKKDAWTLAN